MPRRCNPLCVKERKKERGEGGGSGERRKLGTFYFLIFFLPSPHFFMDIPMAHKDGHRRFLSFLLALANQSKYTYL